MLFIIFSSEEVDSCLLKICVTEVSYRDLRLCIDVTISEYADAYLQELMLLLSVNVAKRSKSNDV